MILNIDDLINLNGLLYFLAHDGDKAFLWKFDGTENGTNEGQGIQKTV